MVVGVLVLDLRLPGCRSLKEKRRLLRPLIERARSEYRVGVSEVDDHDLWGNAVVCAALPGEGAPHVERVLNKVERLFEEHPDIEVVSIGRDTWRPN